MNSNLGCTGFQFFSPPGFLRVCVYFFFFGWMLDATATAPNGNFTGVPMAMTQTSMESCKEHTHTRTHAAAHVCVCVRVCIMHSLYRLVCFDGHIYVFSMGLL